MQLIITMAGQEEEEEPQRGPDPGVPSPEITNPPIPRPGVPAPEITNPIEPSTPSGPGTQVVPPGTPMIQTVSTPDHRCCW